MGKWLIIACINNQCVQKKHKALFNTPRRTCVMLPLTWYCPEDFIGEPQITVLYQPLQIVSQLPTRLPVCVIRRHTQS